jgi:hypothetical protein
VEDRQLLKSNFKALSKFKTNIRNIEENGAKYKPPNPKWNKYLPPSAHRFFRSPSARSLF